MSGLVIEEYLREFERWTAGSLATRLERRAELAEHLRAAEDAGELDQAITRLGSPRDAARAFAEGQHPVPSPLPRRVAAIISDYLMSAVLLVPALAIASAQGWAETVQIAGYEIPTSVGGEGPEGAMGVLMYGLVLLFLLWLGVGLAIAEWRFGRTPGKAIFGLRTISEDGIALSFGQAILRRLPLVFSGPLQLIDWMFVFFNPKRQRAFDTVARTIVVRDLSSEATRAGVPVSSNSFS